MSEKITPCLWFDTEGEEAANFYTSVFPNSKITDVARYPEGNGMREPGSVMVVTFTLDGQDFMALNGGPQFPHSEAVSFQISTADQAETDYYWDALVAGGGEHGPCGWLKDRFGVSWQVTPRRMIELMSDPDPARVQRYFAAMMTMTRLDIAAAEAAVEGRGA
jgi:predicted 3-demethylubiquinone-9 3-methyltransferase (glyoxalase superfamily)